METIETNPDEPATKKKTLLKLIDYIEEEKLPPYN